MSQIKLEDITLEAGILKLLSQMHNFRQFNEIIDHKRLIPTTAFLLKDYARYFEKYNEDINFEVFYNDFCLNWHKKDLDERDLTYYRDTVFPMIQEAPVSMNVLFTLIEREAANKLLDVIDSGFNYDDVHKVLDEYAQTRDKYMGTKDEDIFKLSEQDLTELDSSNGLPWFLPSLQAGLDSHMPGQFVVVAADSDTGKSAFCISQAAHIFKILNERGSNRPILYATSEDTAQDLTCRFFSCLYRDQVIDGFEGIVKKYEKVTEEYHKQYNDNLFIGMSIRGASDVYKLRQKIKKYNPSLIIIDMLDKMAASDNIIDLTKLYQEIRGIANDGYPIIGTSQSGNTSYQDKSTGEFKHRKWLNEKDLANSKSGKQGAAYSMIMIGKDDEVPGVRYLQTTKKKRGRHVRATCELIDKFSLYQELL